MAIESFDVVAKSSLGGSQPVPGSPPTFLQVQSNGTNLGGADVSKLNFSTGTTATRGTGENADTVTVTASGGGGGGADPTLVLNLQGLTNPVFGDPAGAGGEGDYNNFEATVVLASADAQWDDYNQAIRYSRTGIYAVRISGRVSADDSSWPINNETVFGSFIANALGNVRSVYARKAQLPGLAQSSPSMQWFDTFYLGISDFGTQLTPITLYANGYSEISTVAYAAMVEVQRIGDYNPS